MANSFNLWYVDDKHFVVEAYRIVRTDNTCGNRVGERSFLDRSEAEEELVSNILEITEQILRHKMAYSIMPTFVLFKRGSEECKEVEALYAAGKFVNMTAKDQKAAAACTTECG